MDRLCFDSALFERDRGTRSPQRDDSSKPIKRGEQIMSTIELEAKRRRTFDQLSSFPKIGKVARSFINSEFVNITMSETEGMILRNLSSGVPK